MTQPRKYPQLAIRLSLLLPILEANLGDELVSAIRRVAMDGEPFLTLQTESGTVVVPLALEPVDL